MKVLHPVPRSKSCQALIGLTLFNMHPMYSDDSIPILGAVQNCHHFHKITENTVPINPSPSQSIDP